MNSFFAILLIGISLSMDAFSLALIYGMNGMKKDRMILLSLLVGLFHFFMPIIGMIIGNLFISKFIINLNYVVCIIFLIIGIEMIVSSFKPKEVYFFDSIWNYLLFSFSVSFDSLTVGFGIKAINENYLLVTSIFMICSYIFTYLGLLFGNCFNNKLGNLSTVIGGIILLLLSLYYLFRV